MADCEFVPVKVGLSEYRCRYCGKRSYSLGTASIHRTCEKRAGDCKVLRVRGNVTEYRCDVCRRIVYSEQPAERLHYRCQVAERDDGKDAGKEFPGRLRQAWNLAKAMAEFTFDGLRTVSKEEYERRLVICDSCELRLDIWCAHPDCGCNRKIKAWGRVWKCPVGKWRPEQSRAPTQGALNVGIVLPHRVHGGVERWLMDLVRALRDEMHTEIGFVGSGSGDVNEVTQRFGCPCTCLSKATAPAWFADYHLLVAWGVPNLSELVSEFSGPIVGCCHGEDATWSKRFVTRAAPAVSRWVAVSKAALTPLAAMAAERKTVIYNAVDLARCQPTRTREESRKAMGFAPGEFVVGYLGRMSREKRAPVIADAVGAMAGDYRGLLVGYGGQLGKVKTYDGRVVVHPHTYAVGDLLAAMDCLVGLSDHEGFWLAGLEAAAAGVPLVSTRVGVLREIAETRGALWEEVPAGANAAGVAAAIQRVRESGGNPERTAAMRDVARSFTQDRFAAAWKQIIHRSVAIQSRA